MTSVAAVCLLLQDLILVDYCLEKEQHLFSNNI